MHEVKNLGQLERDFPQSLQAVMSPWHCCNTHRLHEATVFFLTFLETYATVMSGD